jgi:flagellar biosynthesis/type III secretory pathway protein FliH
MLTYKNNGIQKYILDRICQINDEIIIEDPEYQELLEQVDQHKKQITAKLPPEDHKLLEDYEGRWIAQLCRQEEIIFNEALMEGMLFGYWVALVARGVEKITV